MKQVIFNILKSKYFYWPVIIITIIASSIIAYFTSIPDKIIFPDVEHYSCFFFTDEANGGNSKIVESAVSDSVIKMSFLLNDAFYSPYVGIIISPLNKKPINARIYNQISFKILGQNIDRIDISIFTSPITLDKNGNQDKTLFHSFLNISGTPKTHQIPIKQLQHPEWWEDMHQMSGNKEDEPDLKEIFHINIGTAFNPDIKSKMELEIYYLAFTRNNQKLFSIIGFIYTILLLLNFGIVYLICVRKNSTSEITISYKPLEITDISSSEEKCIEYINSNYNDSNLTLEKIAKEAGITPRRITNIIHTKFNCNFKTYLNNIRINESKRFLTQTDLNIGEIAFKVGFNSQSHFNRVFKNEINISPSGYKEKHKT